MPKKPVETYLSFAGFGIIYENIAPITDNAATQSKVASKP
jgi:hypothetical protein